MNQEVAETIEVVAVNAESAVVEPNESENENNPEDEEISSNEKSIQIRTALDQIMVICNENQENFKEIVAQTMIGTKVIAKYDTKTACIIENILWDMNPEKTVVDRMYNSDKFNLIRQISIAEYLTEKYGYEITDMNQPMLLGRQDGHGVGAERILLVPEICWPSIIEYLG